MGEIAALALLSGALMLRLVQAVLAALDWRWAASHPDPGGQRLVASQSAVTAVTSLVIAILLLVIALRAVILPDALTGSAEYKLLAGVAILDAAVSLATRIRLYQQVRRRA